MQEFKQLLFLYLLTLLAFLFGCENGGKDKDEECEAYAFYGPGPGCSSDRQCQERHDAGNWYCYEEQVEIDSCGNYGTLSHCVETDAGTDAGQK